MRKVDGVKLMLVFAQELTVLIFHIEPHKRQQHINYSKIVSRAIDVHGQDALLRRRISSRRSPWTPHCRSRCAVLFPAWADTMSIPRRCPRRNRTRCPRSERFRLRPSSLKANGFVRCNIFAHPKGERLLQIIITSYCRMHSDAGQPNLDSWRRQAEPATRNSARK